MTRRLVCVLSILVLGGLIAYPLTAAASPGIEVFPLEYDFGDVEVGMSSTTIVTISNVGEDFHTIESSPACLISHTK